MARPQKTGLDYFPLDVYLDTKLKLIEASFGLTGFAVIIKLWQKTYAEHGYFCEFDEESALLFSAENHIDMPTLEALIETACRRGIFDKDRYDSHRILTSHGIQKRYLEGAHRRNTVNLDSRYLLLKTEELTDNVTIDGVFVNRNGENANGGTQRKGKKTTEKDRIFSPQYKKKADPLPKKSAFNNYVDTNPIDYDALREYLLDSMLDPEI